MHVGFGCIVVSPQRFLRDVGAEILKSMEFRDLLCNNLNGGFVTSRDMDPFLVRWKVDVHIEGGHHDGWLLLEEDELDRDANSRDADATNWNRDFRSVHVYIVSRQMSSLLSFVLVGTGHDKPVNLIKVFTNN
jgi:hypothetical protein